MAYPQPRYIFGIHDPGGEGLMLNAGRRGWIVFSEVLGSDPNDHKSRDYSPWTSQNFGVIVRLNNAYKPEGTIPRPEHYEAFARRCANFVAASRGCDLWILGNEMNFWVERPGAYAATTVPDVRDLQPGDRDLALRALPDRFSALHPRLMRTRGEDRGEPITPSLYARCYRLCRNAIRNVKGHENDKVLTGAVAPWNNNTTYPGNEIGDWVHYFQDILTALGPDECDGITLHTYTHGADPALVTSEERMQAPFRNRHLHFYAYRDFMAAVPDSMKHLPVYITETDEDVPWVDQNNGWVRSAYAEINAWNRADGTQKIRALALYRWQDKDRWVISDKSGVIADMRAAMRHAYVWRNDNPDPPSQVTPSEWNIGDRVQVVQPVRMRRTPGVVGKLGSDTITILPQGTRGVIVGGPQVKDGYAWWQLEAIVGDEQYRGWCAEGLAPEHPLLRSAPAEEPGRFKKGQQVQTETVVRLRRTPGYRNKSDNDILTDLNRGVVATVLEGPRDLDGLTWWRIEAETAEGELRGWSAEAAPGGVELLAPYDNEDEEEPDQPGQPKPPPKFVEGMRVYAAVFLNLRNSPGYVGKTPDDVIAQIGYGQALTLRTNTPQNADGLKWWRVSYEFGGVVKEGWVAETDGEGTQLLMVDPPPPPDPIQIPGYAGYAIGERVANIAPFGVNVRRTPGFRSKQSGDIVFRSFSGQLLEIVAGFQSADGLVWWRVRPEGGGETGWIAESSPFGVRFLTRAAYKDELRLWLPFQGSHPVTQAWGANPDFYRRFTYDGVPLRGHNGVDYGTPMGTPILATADGKVIEASFMADGLGNWVLLRHPWGDSVYGHLNTLGVRSGEEVSAGQQIGESGNSGNSTGPHLHFSIRIEPYYRADGWGGYCDPTPLFEGSPMVVQSSRSTRNRPTAPPPERPGRRLP